MIEVLFLLFLISFVAPEPDFDNDFIINEAKKYGYSWEFHEVETSDGYILGIHRIFNQSFVSRSREVVLFVHGLIMNGVSWDLGGKSSLTHLLADRGYDVWLFNSRGNKVSEKHRNLTVEDPLYWKYSWHEIGKIDVPQTIDYILRVTNRPNLHYVGHSQGGGIFAIMLSLFPEYNGYIKTAFLMAPAIYIKHSTTIGRMLISPVVRSTLKDIGESLNIYKFRFQTELGRKMIELALLLPGVDFFMHLIIGPPSGNENQELRNLVMYETLDASSVNQFIHFAQSMETGMFREFDYDQANMAIYGSPTPPLYDLSKVRVPVAVVYGGHDALVAPQDVKQAIKEMGNSVVKEYFYRNWQHFDFIYPINTQNELFPKMIKFYRKYK